MNIKSFITALLLIFTIASGLITWCPGETAAREKTSQDYPATRQTESGSGLASKGPKKGDIDETRTEGPPSGEEHGQEVVRLSAGLIKEFGIELSIVKAGSIDQYVELPGEIRINQDRLSHVVPRVSGIVRGVRKTVGDSVKTGELLAVLESRELAAAKAAYLAAVERKELAQANFKREERLWRQKVTSEQEYLTARQALAETRIAMNSAEQQLHTLGFSETYLEKLPKQSHITYTRFEIRTPFAGTIIKRHITLGEKVNTDAEVFTIADLSTVWIDINIYQKDLALIQKGQVVQIEIGHNKQSVVGKIAWVGPLVGESTRTATARVVVPNPSGVLRPGLFVNAKVAVSSNMADIVVPKSALQTFEDRTVVFVRTDEGFKPQPVKLGRRNTTRVEVLSGLETGQTYVSKGAFLLKSQLSKAAFGDGHNH
ncbi:MAG: efflux RND transporter periplasmic adaptor subunit [Desulfarculus sp.]|nr:efflux RND transporter periplasmic adaptor subunit [Pseudomonadota bacterium]MBV1736590.1 efflux RND transporter periplasmic adaptor subunit [Desulfarculus sp.]